MTTALSASLPTDPKTGLTLPLTRSLALPELAKHRAMIGIELEVLAKKFDRYGWERDRNSPAHDRIVTDWMDALQDYPLGEVRAACRACVIDDPKRMPNEGAVLAQIMDARRRHVAAIPKPNEVRPNVQPMTAARRANADEILAAAGFALRRGMPS